MSAKYKLIVDEIERDILDGKYNSIGKLPTEEELVATYGVSRTTVRKAIGILSSKGYIYQVQGSGIFIRDKCAKMLRRKGFHHVEVTKKSGDQGVDILAYKGFSK